MFLNEREKKQIIDGSKRIWAKAFWPLLTLLCGVLFGWIGATSEIVNDCKYAGAFRVDSQAFNCQRKI